MEIQLAWRSPGNLGPTSGNAEGAVTTAIQHVSVSLAGGAVAMGLAWAIGRSRRSS